MNLVEVRVIDMKDSFAVLQNETRRGEGRKLYGTQMKKRITNGSV